MRITGRGYKGSPITIDLEGTSSSDCTAHVTCASLTNAALNRYGVGLAVQMDKAQDGATHCLRTPKGSIGITSEEAARINAEYKGWLATLPAERAWRLHAHRDDLVAAYRGALDEVEYQRNRWFEAECKRGPLPDYETDERVNMAMAELRAFDEAHPEVYIEIEAEKARAAAAHMWD